jgi:chitinase
MLRRTKSLLGAAALALGSTAAIALTVSGNASAATPALSAQWYAAAPYLMPEDNSPPDVSAVMDATGQKAFQLAFILAPSGGGCTPTWGGTSPVSTDTGIPAAISTIRSKGGDVSVSIGGYGGTKLGQTCGTAAATAAAYQQVIDKYGLHAMDFDLEEPEYESAPAIANELGAAQILQANNPGIYISVTMPGTTAGTGWFGTQLLDNAKSLGFTPNAFSIMPFDGGFNGAASQDAALDSFHSLLMSHMGWDSATAYAHEGVSLMNGRTDAAEYFTQADFATVLNYVTSHGMGRYTFWSVNRDRQCTGTVDPGLSGACSSVTQNAWDFTRYTVQFAGATPPPPPPTSSSSSSSPGGQCTAATWSSTTAYNGGAVVSYGGHTWTAKWWTQGDIPGNNSQGVWTDDGVCSGGGTTTSSPPPGTCSAPAWVSTTAYNGGAVVSYGGHTWTAKWWTQGDIPGNNSQGVWTDNGAC